MHAGPPLKQELGQVPAATHMGQPSTNLTHVPTQANTTTNYQHITPLLVSPLPISPIPISLLLLSIQVGGTFFLLFPMESKCIHPQITPSPHLHRSTAAPSW